MLAIVLLWAGCSGGSEPIVDRSGASAAVQSRHIDGPGHNTSGSKDLMFGNGGAWDYELTWLAQYAGSSVNSTPGLRCSAAEFANVIAQLAYVVPGPATNVPSYCSML